MDDGLEGYALKTLSWIFISSRRIGFGLRMEGNNEDNAHKLQSMVNSKFCVPEILKESKEESHTHRLMLAPKQPLRLICMQNVIWQVFLGTTSIRQ